MNALKWVQKDNRNYSLEDSQGNIHLRLENRTCSQSNITNEYLEECKKEFLENEKQKGRTL